MKIAYEQHGRIWTPGQLLRAGSRRLFELVHGHRGPRVLVFNSKLYARHFRGGRLHDDRGLVCEGVVTDVFAEDLVDNLIAEGVPFGEYRFHVSGTTVVGEDPTDDETDIISATTPAPISGTQAENTSKVYQSVATVPYVSTLVIVQHGLINNIVQSGSILMDHSQFGAINVDSGDSIEFTYELTVNSGG